MYVVIDAELHGIDNFPEYEIGEYANNGEERVITVGERGGMDVFIAGKVEDKDIADYTYLVTVDQHGDAIEKIEELIGDDLELIFDYELAEYVIAREQ